MATKKKSSSVCKIFLASAADCCELRDAANSLIGEINNSLAGAGVYLDLYMWEENKKAEFIKPGERYQDKIFDEFGDHCDIFVVFFWTKLGVGTEEEYEHFKTKFLAINPGIKFIGFHYNKPMSHEVLEKHDTYYKLLDFINKNEKDWAPLGRVRRSINNKKIFVQELRTAIYDFLTEKKFIKGK